MDRASLRAQLARTGALPMSAVARLARETAASGGRALLVGGYVRDALIGRETDDADVEVYGLPADALEALLTRLFPDRVNAVGRAFGIFRVALAPGLDLDVSLPRTESKTGSGHRGFAVHGDPALAFEEASRRRDFTVNALACDLATGEVLDAHGGLDDLERGVLRAVDPHTFPEDPLRVWRAFQLAARLGFALDAATAKLIRGIVARGELAELSRERITEELRKLLAAERPSAGLTLALDAGALGATFPELAALAATPQDPEWHPEGDVWTHTLMVVDQAAAVVQAGTWELTDQEATHVLLGCLVHDVGKAPTTQEGVKDGRTRIVSPRHEVEGEPLARAILDRLTFGDDAARAVLAIVRWHLAPGSLYYALERGELETRSYTNAVRKVLKRIHPVRWQVLLAACEGDWRGRGIDGVLTLPFDPGLRFARAVAEDQLDVAPAAPLVQGRDVLVLGIPAGPRVGTLIREVEDARDRGEIRTREEALDLLRRLTASS